MFPSCKHPSSPFKKVDVLSVVIVLGSLPVRISSLVLVPSGHHDLSYKLAVLCLPQEPSCAEVLRLHLCVVGVRRLGKVGMLLFKKLR